MHVAVFVKKSNPNSNPAAGLGVTGFAIRRVGCLQVEGLEAEGLRFRGSVALQLMYYSERSCMTSVYCNPTTPKVYGTWGHAGFVSTDVLGLELKACVPDLL